MSVVPIYQIVRCHILENNNSNRHSRECYLYQPHHTSPFTKPGKIEKVTQVMLLFLLPNHYVIVTFEQSTLQTRTNAISRYAMYKE